MAKAYKTVPFTEADVPVPPADPVNGVERRAPVPGMTESDREWVRNLVAEATKPREEPEKSKAALKFAGETDARHRAWTRNEIRLAASGVSEGEREEMNP